jgi:hypothetical protein
MTQPNLPDHQHDTPGRPSAREPKTPRNSGLPRHEAPSPATPPPAPVTRRSVAARLLLIAPAALGVLLAEGIFATRGADGDVVSIPAAGVALVLLWFGVAWALHSWVALLMTFVPAVMISLGAALVGESAPGAGVALLLVGLALLSGIVRFRLSVPDRGWSPGWSSSTHHPGEPWPAVGSWSTDGITPRRAGGDENGGDGPSGARGVVPPGPAPVGRPLDPWGAHFLQRAASGPQPACPEGSPPDRPAPDWDTSGTDIAARDRFVALLCRRGGTAGPTLATLEEFFTGNGDPRSIAPGLRGAVPLSRINAVLHRLRDHRGVAEVLVQVEPLEAGRYPAGEWPVAGSVHVIATLDAAELDALVEPLRAEPALGPLPADELTSGDPAPAGSSEYAMWWA